MPEVQTIEKIHAVEVLLGDEAVASAAIDAGITAAYAYPGTPSTEILEYIRGQALLRGRPAASWCANEKTAYEQALGMSMAGRRSLVSMKHVGLNVAADPFVNSAIVSIDGGLVLAVADDPGMHSSQNEQDSRFYADFARILCLEPADQQQAYDMTRDAFELSERFRIPVMVRLVTRLAHGRAPVRRRAPAPENPFRRSPDKRGWILLPAIARKLWRELLERQEELRDYGEHCSYTELALNSTHHELGVITTGIARNYYLENLRECATVPSHLHIGSYPAPPDKLRILMSHVKEVLVLEDGYPLVEDKLRGIVEGPVPVRGKRTGQVPLDGELTPDAVRRALGLVAHESVEIEPFKLPARPPQLCRGCPHGDAYTALNRAMEGREPERALVTSDIGCYTLGVLPPFEAGESCVCMGASIGMAKGAAEAGSHPVVAVIGDSTFLHSGVTPLMDAVAADTDMTVLILDNEVVAMTGIQPSLLPPARLERVVLGLGVDPEHCHLVETHPRKVDTMAELLRGEMDHRGLSVIIAVRECLEAAKRRRREERDSS